MIRVSLIFGALLLATPANAHGAMAGGGGFYAGLSHPFVALEHLLVLLATGLLLGRRPKQDAVLPLICLAVALSAALASGAAGLGLTVFPGALLGLGIVAGGLLASGVLPPIGVMTLLAVATGVCVGLDTDVPAVTAASDINVYTTYLGVCVAVFLIVLDMVALSLLVRRPPFTIGLRIAGSWIAAVSLMVLALQFRGTTGAI